MRHSDLQNQETRINEDDLLRHSQGDLNVDIDNRHLISVSYLNGRSSHLFGLTVPVHPVDDIYPRLPLSDRRSTRRPRIEPWGYN